MSFEGSEIFEGKYFALKVSNDKPQKTFFYKNKKTGRTFTCGANEANNIKHFHEQLGHSDGTTYHRMIVEAVEKQNKALRALKKERPDLSAEEYHIKREAIEAEAKDAVDEAFQAELEVALANGKATPPRTNVSVAMVSDELRASGVSDERVMGMII